MDFANPAEWASTIDAVRPLSESAILESLEAWNKNKSVRDRFSTGLISIVEYMKTYNGLNENADLSPDELRVFSKLQQWRLNFMDESVRSRFRELSERLILCLAEDEVVQRDLGEESSSWMIIALEWAEP